MTRPSTAAPLLLAFAALSAGAATPESGTISESSLNLSYTFPASLLANTSGAVETNYVCDAINPCDEFTLTVDLAPDYLDRFPDAQILIQAATDVEFMDIDLQVSDESGTVLYNYRDNPPEQPQLLVFPNGGLEKYIVQVVPGSPHSGGSVSISFTPGTPAKSGLFGGALSFGALLALAGFGLSRRRPH